MIIAKYFKNENEPLLNQGSTFALNDDSDLIQFGRNGDFVSYQVLQTDIDSIELDELGIVTEEPLITIPNRMLDHRLYR